VKVAEGMGCKALRVFDPEKIQESIQAARKMANELSLPVVVEVITERVTDIAMGPEIDKITEFEEVVDVEEPEEFLEQLAA
jgi:tartronate-semialdehyde synthase